MTKHIKIYLTVLCCVLWLMSAAAAKAQANLNPLTGLAEENPEMMNLPPVLIPMAKFPDKYRPTAGLNDAAWVYEFYDIGGISRPVALFYGHLPQAANESHDFIGPIASAMYGVEDLRNHYGALMITAGNRAHVAADGLFNVQHWYGESGGDLFPQLPIQKLEKFINEWAKKIQSPDRSLLQLTFSYGLPDSGQAAKSLLIRYADTNQALWEYDPSVGLYFHSRNSISNPSITPDIDTLSQEQLTAHNVILMFHETEKKIDGYKPLLNFIDRQPALLFRDGIRIEGYWSTENTEAETATDRFRPIQFYLSNGEPFSLKPGRTWVHLIRVGNELKEIADATGGEENPGSGHWFLPYIEAKR